MGRLSFFLAPIASLLVAPPVLAQNVAGDERAHSAFQITPYVWASGFGGTIQPLPGAPAFRVSKSFGDLLKDLDAAFFISGLARVGRFVAVADFSHTSSSKEGIVQTPIPEAPFVPAEGGLKQTSLTLLGGVRAVDQSDITIDLLAGIRAFWIDTAVEAPALGVAQSADVNFVDPILAGRINARLGDGWTLLVYGDFGGFGAGSDFTAQAVSTVNMRVARQIWLSAGYRYLMTDYRGPKTRADVHLGGPLVGASFIF